MTAHPADTPVATRPPLASAPFTRFLAVGPIGVALGAAQYEILWWLNPLGNFRASSTWLVASVIGVAWIHAIHCRFTFAATGRGRWRATIGRAYLLYATSIALGAIAIWALVDVVGFQRNVSWLLTSAAMSLFNFVFLRRLLAPRASDRAPARWIALEDVTVVVPVKDERANIDAFLDSLPDEVSLVVVDAGNDGTRERTLERRAARTRVLSLGSNIPVARQRGAELAETSWLLFTDVDVSFAPGYFAHLAAMTVDDQVGGIVGTKTTLERFRGYYRLFALGQRCCAFVGIPAATGSNMLLRREALLACGGFDPELSVNEDSEVMWRCQRNGYAVRLETTLVVHEQDHRRLERGVSRKLLHSAVRCVALYLDILPRRWRRADWGYWKPTPRPADLARHS